MGVHGGGGQFEILACVIPQHFDADELQVAHRNKFLGRLQCRNRCVLQFGHVAAVGVDGLADAGAAAFQIVTCALEHGGDGDPFLGGGLFDSEYRAAGSAQPPHGFSQSRQVVERGNDQVIGVGFGVQCKAEVVEVDFQQFQQRRHEFGMAVIGFLHRKTLILERSGKRFPLSFSLVKTRDDRRSGSRYRSACFDKRRGDLFFRGRTLAYECLIAAQCGGGQSAMALQRLHDANQFRGGSQSADFG